MDLVYYESPPGLQLLHCLRLCVYVRVCAHSSSMIELSCHSGVEMMMTSLVVNQFY